MKHSNVQYVDEYSKESGFSLFEATSSHIIYRSNVSSHTTEKFPKLESTIDIVFVGTMYFELLPYLGNIYIQKAKSKKSIDLAKKYDKGFEFLKSNERVYKIQSGKKACFTKPTTSYLVTAGIWIYEHN